MNLRRLKRSFKNKIAIIYKKAFDMEYTGSSRNSITGEGIGLIKATINYETKSEMKIFAHIKISFSKDRIEMVINLEPLLKMDSDDPASSFEKTPANNIIDYFFAIDISTSNLSNGTYRIEVPYSISASFEDNWNRLAQKYKGTGLHELFGELSLPSSNYTQSIKNDLEIKEVVEV